MPYVPPVIPGGSGFNPPPAQAPSPLIGQDYAAKRAAAKAARGAEPLPLSKAEQRAAEAKLRVSGGRRVDAPRSAAHAGVAANPLKAQQTILDKKRAEYLEQGTSIARMGRGGEGSAPASSSVPPPAMPLVQPPNIPRTPLSK
jgi:hypothetical protein